VIPPPDRRLAVALRYDAPGAPRVVASGRGLVGQRIVATAEAHGVPIEHNPALAEALSGIELETAIPPELYVAVAEILGFIMRASAET
jgi:flagellar biosynthesis protein